LKPNSVTKKKSQSAVKPEDQNVLRYVSSSYNRNNAPTHKKTNSHHYRSVDSKFNSYNQLTHKHSRSTANISDFMKRQKANPTSLSSKARVKSA